ncbi:hypothetical protein ABZ543_08425 [Streptomyces roseifaciens]
MIENILSGCLGVLAVTALLRAVTRALAARRRRSYARFRVGPLRLWCPAEGRMTPHQLDAGVRRCLVCKTTTPAVPEENDRG